MTSQREELIQTTPAEAETTLEALRRQEVDAVIGNNQVLLLRLHEAEQNLRESEERLRALNRSLEQRIADRTAELEQQTRRLRQLAAELTDAEQQERKKLAGILHDGLQQILMAAEINLSLAGIESDPDALAHTKELLAEAKQVARSLAYELAPPALYESSFPDALTWLTRWFGENHRFQVALEANDNLPALTETAKVFLFHAVRELLLNSVKHSTVNQAVVRCVNIENDWLQIEVFDKGQGFDPACLDSPAGIDKGFGLLSIRERLISLGGALEINSEPGAGVHFNIHFPLEA